MYVHTSYARRIRQKQQPGISDAELTLVTARVGPMMDPRLAPARMRPNADLAVSTSIDALTKDQKWDTQMLPNDSIAQYETQPGRALCLYVHERKNEGTRRNNMRCM